MTRPDSALAPEAVYDLLYRLGLTATSSAFFHLSCAVYLASAQPQRLLSPAWLYPAVARCYRTTPEAVARSIHGLTRRAWQNAPEALSCLAGTPLRSAPAPIRFLTILAQSLRGGRAA